MRLILLPNGHFMYEQKACILGMEIAYLFSILPAMRCNALGIELDMVTKGYFYCKPPILVCEA